MRTASDFNAHLANCKDYPPRQKPGTISLDAVLARLLMTRRATVVSQQ